MSNILKVLSRGGVAAPPADPNFNQTVLLLHGDGTNGAQNNTFLDSSTNNFTITRNGNTTQGTFSPFSLAAGEWSNFFDGSGDYLVTPSNAALSSTLLASDFTIETWLYLTAAPSDGAPIWTNSVSDSDGFSTSYIYNNLSIGTGKAGVNEFVSAANVLTLNQWNHFACVRNGSTVYIYVNGTQVASGAAATYLNTTATKPMTFGRNYQTSPAAITGYYSNTRVVSSAVYTSAFTPPTAPLTAITNTQLLTCQSNRFVDNSTNNFAITRNGDVSVQPFSPFLPTAEYDASVNGGSGTFISSGAYLNTGSSTELNLGSNDFTWELWTYFVGNPSSASSIFQPRTPAGVDAVLFAYTSGSNLSIYATTNGSTWNLFSDTTITSIASVLNRWAHWAFVRNGSSYTVYLDGVNKASATSASNISQATNVFTISDTGTSNAYIADFRFVKGQALATGDFTPPTSPVTTSSVGWTGANAAASLTGDVNLLLNFTNAGIFDNTGKNNLETVGDAQIDTTTKKYGTGSIEFDGTGDWLKLPSNPNQALGTGNFTIEAWVYINTAKNYNFIYETRANDFSSAGLGFFTDASSRLCLYTDYNFRIQAGTVTIAVWNHVALVRSGGTFTAYVNGSSVGTYSATPDLTLDTVRIGIDWNSTFSMDGFIDDLRITKGIARYTANFTPPTAAFPNL